jgi:lipopolysaccharide transport system ATP-binding protein
MNKDTVITVENLSKKFVISAPGHNTIRDQFDDFIKHPFGIGSQKKSKVDFWALRDVSFEIKRGDVVGVIGRNGSGKSTLLKILSRIMEPTEGRATMKGRVASLLEVGTGFNPELTGRENIYLNGAILGMSQKEIDGKFDEIVEFSGVSQFINTPVKRYSSGMYVRLAFSVAAHLDTDILLVDEVLAVGDVEFQKKSLGKMKDLATGGRTVLFVSHNMSAISRLCNNGIVLKDGVLEFYGNVHKTIEKYSELNLEDKKIVTNIFNGPLSECFDEVCLNYDANPRSIDPTLPLKISVNYKLNRDMKDLVINLSLYRDGIRIFTVQDFYKSSTVSMGRYISQFVIESNTMRPGRYTVGVGGFIIDSNEWFYCDSLSDFNIQEKWNEQVIRTNLGLVNVPKLGSRFKVEI